MNFSLLLVPALAGYWFLSRANATRFRVYRQAGYALVLESAIMGVILLTFAWLIALSFECILAALGSIGADFVEKIKSKPFEYSGTVLCTAVLALVLPSVLNRFHDENEFAREEAMKNGDLIELLMQESLDESTLVELSMNSGKSYIGLALESGVASPRSEPDVSLIPLASGYRTSKSRRLVLTTNYASIIDEFDKQSSSQLNASRWRVVVPRSKIISAQPFDPEVYRSLSS